MKDLSLYDILGVLAPGTVLTVGVVVLFPGTTAIINNKDFSVGDFGLIVLVSYVMGNLVAALGNVLEHLYWRLRGGWPTERARHSKHQILQSRSRREALQARLRQRGFIEPAEEIANLGDKDWRQLARRLYTFIEQRGPTRRIDLFNAQYGMNRGIAVGFLALIAQGAKRSVMVSTSWPIPAETTDQPPHVETYRRYNETRDALDAELIVTMEHPSESNPKRTVITIDAGGPTLKKEIAVGIFSITSAKPPRMG